MELIKKTDSFVYMRYTLEEAAFLAELGRCISEEQEVVITEKSVEVPKKDKKEEMRQKTLQRQLENPFHGSDADMRMFLLALDRKFEGKWVHVDDEEVEELLESHGKSRSTLCNKLRKLEERNHCQLKKKGNFVKKFYLTFNKN